MYTFCFPLTVNRSLHLRPVLCEATFRLPQLGSVPQSFNVSLPIRVYDWSSPLMSAPAAFVVEKTDYTTCTFVDIVLDFPEQLLVTWTIGKGYGYIIRNVTQTAQLTGTYLDPPRHLIPLSTLVSTAEIFIPNNHNITTPIGTICSAFHGLSLALVVHQIWDVPPPAPPVRPTTTTTTTATSANAADSNRLQPTTASEGVGTPAKSQTTQAPHLLVGRLVAGAVGALSMLVAGVYLATRRGKTGGGGGPSHSGSPGESCPPRELGSSFRI
ncbi:uncharacterized protein [Littorina saxatilis]|uniref:Uncharacterized protein n=1 Tax=Littorina saxatilis TaxID=31220 RepID=A0AAN9GKV7_9CAEN